MHTWLVNSSVVHLYLTVYLAVAKHTGERNPLCVNTKWNRTQLRLNIGMLVTLCVCVCVCVCTVSSGSVTVNADSSVQLLAEEAVPLDQLDIAVSIIAYSCHCFQMLTLAR